MFRIRRRVGASTLPTLMAIRQGSAKSRGRRWLNWTLGVALGGAGILALINAGVVGLVLVAGTAVMGARLLQSAMFVGGMLVAIGGSWAILLTAAQMRCDAANRAFEGGCRGESVGLVIIPALVSVVLGVLITVGATKSAGMR